MQGILFVHQNFPGQFPHIAAAMVARGETCMAIGSGTARGVPGVRLERWSTQRGSTREIFPIATRAEADLIRGRAAADAAQRLKRGGFEPRVIVGHPGWGETLLLREVWPDARQIVFGEFFYRTRGGDVGFDPEFGPLTTEEAYRVAAKNMGIALALAEADVVVAPTAFQAGLLPKSVGQRAVVLHEGVDTDAAQRAPAKVRLPNGRLLDGSTPAITYVSRSLEPLRGFHIFMRALPALLDAVPDAEILVVGSDTHPPYGGPRKDGRTWKAAMLSELAGKLDLARVHFTGQVPHAALMKLFSVSWAHVYYTYPFVLSWSLLEAMSAECLVVASDTAPVRDAVTDGHDGLLLDFFDVAGLSRTLTEVCRDPGRFAPLRQAARRTVVERFDRERVGTPGWVKLLS